MKTIYLCIINEGWKSFNFDDEETKILLKNRFIKIGYGAEIGDGAKIGDEAEIDNKKIILKTLSITGTKHPVLWYGENIIHIGCHKKEINWWIKNYKLIGQKENYSLIEIEEYHQYILICQQMQNQLNNERIKSNS
jgi:hypothetical protein